MTILDHPFMTHLAELRTRLMWCLGLIFTLFIVFFLVKEQLLNAVLLPLSRSQESPASLIYTGVPDLFFTYLKTAIWMAFFVGLPFILWQLWRFIAPGLYENERQVALPLLVATPLLFYTGLGFTWWVIMPLVIDFFLAFQTQQIQAMLSVKEYLGFFVRLALGFGLAFELPVLLVLLARASIVNLKMLTTGRKFAVVGIVIFAAIFTPPDPASQMLLALPMIVLYEVGVLCVRLTGSKESSNKADEAGA